MSSRPDADSEAPARSGPAPKEQAAVAEPSSSATAGAVEEAAPAPSRDDGVHGDSPSVGTEGPAGGEGPDAPEGAEAAVDVQDDLDELVATAAQRDEYLALAQRTQADFENYRKRMSRDVAAAQTRGLTRLTLELAPALDNLERALAAATEGEGSLSDGVRLVQSELLSALRRVGIESFSPQGEVFDPQQHEAVAQQPVEGAKAGTVVEVYQAGYRLSETIIRPARVVVAS